jgi:hypothetical protein
MITVTRDGRLIQHVVGGMVMAVVFVVSGYMVLAGDYSKVGWRWA